MACKVASRGLFARLFHDDPQPPSTPTICQELIQSLDVSAGWRSAEHLRSCLRTISTSLETTTSTALEKNALLSGLLDAQVPMKIMKALPGLEFEAAKDCMRLFNQILKLGTSPVVDYISSHKQILQMLLDGCGDAQVSLHSNNMLRSCTQHPRLVDLLLDAGFAAGLVKLAQHESFDISSDAFCSLRELLMTCKAVSAEYIADNHHVFFVAYHELLLSEDYFTKRQALGLLAEMLMDPSFDKLVPCYVGNDTFLQVTMNLLRDSSKPIQCTAFRVFRVFLDDTLTSTRVQRILWKNKDRLIRLVDSMSKQGDEGFAEECSVAIEALQTLALPSRKTSSEDDSPTMTSQTWCQGVPAFQLPEPSKNSQSSTAQAIGPEDYALHLLQCQAVF